LFRLVGHRPLKLFEFLGSFRQNATFVMAGLDPAIHAFLRAKQGVDARDIGER
jgi:hypothetical protein